MIDAGQDAPGVRRAGRRRALRPGTRRRTTGSRRRATTSSRRTTFTCEPNRGPADAPLFLVNHWVSASPPDPSEAAKANDAKLLLDRARRQCAEQRGRVPNVVAVDFAVRGKIAVDRARRGRGAARPRATATTTSRRPRASSADHHHDRRRPRRSTTVPTGRRRCRRPPSSPRLTGGDPALFCPALVAVAPVITAWAYAEFSATDADAGRRRAGLRPGAHPADDAPTWRRRRSRSPTWPSRSLARAAAAVDAPCAARPRRRRHRRLADQVIQARPWPTRPTASRCRRRWPPTSPRRWAQDQLHGGGARRSPPPRAIRRR